MNRPGRRKLGQGRNSWQWAKHAWLYSDLPQALEGKISSALGSQQKGTLISVFTVPHCGWKTGEGNTFYAYAKFRLNRHSV